MTTTAPAPDDVLAKVDTLGPPGTPVTTPEVAEGFDCTKRTIYNRLDSLAEDGVLQTKKVGANSRVWWRPAQDRREQREHTPNGGEPNFVEERPNWESTVLGSGGEMADRIDEFEWAETPLGPMAEWPRELRTAVDIMLGAEEAIGIYWGDDLVLLYNDAWRELIGDKHLEALGEPARDVFPEIWETIGPMFADVLDGEGAAIEREHLLPLERSGGIEDARFDYSATPIPIDDGSVGGIFTVAVEVTDQVRTEQELRETSERLEVALTAAGMGTWEWDLDERTVRGNDTMMSLFELPSSDEPVPVERFLEKMSPEGVTQCERVMESTFEPGEEIQDAIRLDHVDDAPRWVTWRGRVSTDDPSVLRGVSFDITERKTAELHREERYGTLFEEIEEGFCLMEVLFGEDDEEGDYRLLATNPAFEKITGLTDVAGERLRDLEPEYGLQFIEPYEEVVRTNEPKRFEASGHPLLDGWYDVRVLPYGDPGSNEVAVLIDDITERKEAEQRLERQAELNGFRVKLTDAIRPLTDPAEIQREAARVLGEHLDVDRAHYAEVLEDGTTNRIHADYCREGVESVVGEHDFEDYGEYIAATLQAGETLVLNDLSCMPELSDEERAAHRRMDIAAYTSVPLIKDDRLIAYCSVTQGTPRKWTDTEVEIVEETVERTWAAVERAWAERERRESEAKYRTLFESIDEGFCTVEVLFDEDDDPVDYRFLETNPAFEEQTGLVDAEGERMRDLEPNHEEHWFETYGRIALTGEPERFTSEAKHLDDRWFDVYAFRIGEPEERTVAILFQDITERKRLEQELRSEKEQLDIAVENSPLVLFRLDTDLRYTWIKNPDPDFEEVDVLGKREDELVPSETAETLMAPKRRVLETGERLREELTFELPSGEVTYDLTVAPIQDESGDVTGLICAALDITERKRAEKQLRESEAALKQLNAATQELIDAETATITDRVAPLVRDVLDVEYAALWRYDDRRGDLEEHAVDAASDVDTEAVDFSTEISDQVWETFVGTDVDVENDIDVESVEESPLRSRAFVPLGRHGVVCVGSMQAETFDERTVELVETVATTVETAWDRAAGEEELARRNEELTSLDRLNTLIREIDQALVAADTREEIDEAVCERLADSDLYEFAWIGDHDPGTDVVEPRAWAGVDSGYLDDHVITVEENPANRDPIARAVRTGELQVITDIATDSRVTSWREATLERGARSVVCIPLVYDDATHGVLTVYADRPQLDEDERNQQVLSELGDTIAHTINARETRAALQTDSVVELTLRFEDADTPLCRLSRETECIIDFQGYVPRSSGHADVFFIARETSLEDLRDTAANLLAFDDLDCLTEGTDGFLFRARVSDPPLAARVTDEGGVVRSITIDAGVATTVLDVPHTAAVREFLDRLRQWNPDFELRARQSRERPLKTRQTFATSLEDRLTDRQREVLQTAYLSGYFEMPRVSNGQEVTELLGVSQPTFSEHLRAAERTLCEVLFEAESYASDRIDVAEP